MLPVHLAGECRSNMQIKTVMSRCVWGRKVQNRSNGLSSFIYIQCFNLCHKTKTSYSHLSLPHNINQIAAMRKIKLTKVIKAEIAGVRSVRLSVSGLTNAN